MIGVKRTSKINIPLLFLVIGIALALVALSTLFNPAPILLIIKEIGLFLSLFVPGYLLQFVITRKLIRVTLSKGEYIACSFGLSLFLVAMLSFVTSFTGMGVREIFYSYFSISSILIILVLILNRSWILHILSSGFKTPKLPLDKLILFSLLFLVFPLFHLFGFAELNWDGFNFFLRDALAINISNSISAYYPESFYEGNIPLIFNSYLSSVLYSYSLNILDIMDFQGSAPLLMAYTNVALSFIAIATLLAITILLKSIAHRVFKDKYLVAATIIIFLTSPLLNQFLFAWSLYADLFFTFATLLVFVFGYRYLQTEDRQVRWFSLLMIVLGLTLAITTKTYGYITLLIIPLLFLKGFRKHFVFSNFKLERKDSTVPSYLFMMIVLTLFAVLIGFASLYTIRGIMLIDSPFGYSIETLVNFSENERWAYNVLDASGIHESIENYPPLNQHTALLLSYGLFPVFIIPLLVGISSLLKKDLWGLGIFAIYILYYSILFATVLQLRADRHLLSIVPLLSPIIVYGLKGIARYFGVGWNDKAILCAIIILCLLQLPLFDAIYTEFNIANIFPSMFYWYTTDNLVKVLGYSLMAFGIVIMAGRNTLTAVIKYHKEWYIFGVIFGVMVLVIIGWPIISVLDRYVTYEDYIHESYQNAHFAYPAALQEFLEINSNNSSNNKLLYLHGIGTEFLTLGHISYVKIDDFRMLGNMKDVIEEKNPNKVQELLLSKEIKYILYPSEGNHHYRKLIALSNATDNALLFEDPSSITTVKIRLNDGWDLYVI